MKRSLIPLLLFCCALPSVADEFSPPGVVEARVVYGAGDPVPGATITLRLAEEPTTKQVRTALSDVDGAVRFTGVTAGDYVLEVALAGFVPARLGPFRVHDSPKGMPRFKRMTVLLNALAWICEPETASPAGP